MQPITKLSIKNFKAYQDQYFDLSYLTVFCGSNSVGKSTAIQAIGILLQSDFSKKAQLNGDLVHVGNIEDIHNFQNKNEDELIIKITTDEGNVLEWGYKNGEQRDIARQGNYLPSLNDLSDLLLHCDHLHNKLRLQYIEAERFGPRDNLKMAEHYLHPYWLGTKGEYTVEVLNNLISRGRHELYHKDKESGDSRKHPLAAHSRIFENIERWMGEISPGYKLSPQKEEKANTTYNSIISNDGHATKPINIGFGYSYALSIVAALLLAVPGDIVIIENPEAHLHPKGQSYLGRLIALTAKAGVQLIVETHSDHLLNGIRVVTRIDEEFDPKIFTLYYISEGDEQSKVDKITISKDGKLSEWPAGFFDQQAQDMFTIMTGKTKLPGTEK